MRVFKKIFIWPITDWFERRLSRKIMNTWFEHVEQCEGCTDEN